jgi:ornithine carbamoyltransferase
MTHDAVQRAHTVASARQQRARAATHDTRTHAHTHAHTRAHTRASCADTIRTVENYADCIVLRHFQAGSAKRAAVVSSVPILNAGQWRVTRHV